MKGKKNFIYLLTNDSSTHIMASRSMSYRPRRHIVDLYTLTESEERFSELIWDNEPMGSGELVKLCEQQMSWKKSTTYTVLKKLCEKGIFKNKEAVVTSLISKDKYYANQSVRFVEDTFGGSLPRFLTSFISSGKLSKQQAEELKRLIDEHKEG